MRFQSTITWQYIGMSMSYSIWTFRLYVLIIFRLLFGALGHPSYLLKLTESKSPRLLFIMVVIMIYLFVHDDKLTSERFTTRTEN